MKDEFTVHAEYTPKCQIQARIFSALPALLPEREPLCVTCVVMGRRVINQSEIPVRPRVHGGAEGSRGKQHAAPPDSYSRSLGRVNEDKRAGYKAGIEDFIRAVNLIAITKL